MKTVLAKFDSSFFVRNFMRTDALDKILSANDIKLVLLVPEDKITYYKKEFSHPNIIFDAIPNIKKLKIERFFNFLEKFSIHTKTVYMIFRSEFEKARNWSFLRRHATLFTKFFLWQAGRFKFWRKLIRKIYFLMPSKNFIQFFIKYNPDLVFAPYMVFTDFVFLKEAKKTGIKTLGMTLSWDNLYSKTFLLSHPDFLIVQTQKIANQACSMGDFEGELIVAGISQYDRHFTKKDIVPREDFFKKIGADPAKKLLVYAFSGKQGLNIDFDVLRIINEAQRNGEFFCPVEILARPYPRTDFPEDKIKKIKEEYGILSFSSTKHVGTGDSDWEFDEESIFMLENTLFHADIVLTMYSTFFIEAAIFGKSLIGIAFDGTKKRSYWDSASRFFEWDHLCEIKPLNGIWLTKSREELINAINKFLKNPDFLKEGREKILKRQVQFTDGLSAKRVADTIIRLCYLDYLKK